MTYVATSGAAAAAAAKHAQDMQEEEFTSSSTHDYSKYEYKILRAFWPSFKNPYDLKKALDIEKEAGWTLVEKFDNSRIRLKRLLTERENDGERTIDPYRTYFGSDPNTYGLLVLLGTFLFVMFAIFIAAMAASHI